MSKNILYITVAILILFTSIVFDILQKRSFNNSLNALKQERQEIEKVASLKELWSAKNIKSKIERVLQPINKSKKEFYKYKRGKVEFKVNSLSDKEINRLLSKLAKLPIQFKKLLITRSGDQFILECLCVW